MKHSLFKPAFHFKDQMRNLNRIELFEDLLLFDTISFNIIGANQPLLFLIDEIGINKTEELLEKKIIEFVTNIPLVAANFGQNNDGEHDFKGVAPLLSGIFVSQANSDPEFQIDESLKLISGLNRDRKRILKRIALKQYKFPKTSLSSDAHKIILNAYSSNKLSSFGLNNDMAPEDLGLMEREMLANLGWDIIETAVLSQFKYKSKNNSNALFLTKDTVDKLFNAKQVSQNNSEILKYESIPDLKNLFSLKNYSLKDVFELRETRDSKKYRSWINEKTDELKDLSITKEYIDDIAKEKGFFNTNKGKLIKTISMFALSGYVGGQIGNTPGTIFGLGAGKILENAADLGIDLLDEYVLDGLLKGWNPRFFIDEFREKIEIK